MNHLAHLFLSGQNRETLLGNFMGDYIRNNEFKNFSSGIQQGICLHRLIDGYADKHPSFLSSSRRLYASQGKYSPVVIDLFYDHLLAVNWSCFCEMNFNAYCRKMYDMLIEHSSIFPEKLQYSLPRMVKDKWLEKYQTTEGLSIAFGFLKRRANFDNNLENAVSELIADYADFEKEFLEFFPDILKKAEDFNPRSAEKW